MNRSLEDISYNNTIKQELQDALFICNVYQDFIEFLENELGYTEAHELIEKFNNRP